MVEVISQIATASSEQSAGLDEIGRAVMQLENVTQQNAALVEQATASAFSFEEEVRRLSDMARAFVVDAQPVSAAARPSQPSPAARAPARAEPRPRPEALPGRRPKQAALPAGEADDWKEF